MLENAAATLSGHEAHRKAKRTDPPDGGARAREGDVDAEARAAALKENRSARTT